MKAKVLKSRSIFVAAILGVVLGGAAANAQAQRPGQASSSKQQPNAQANGKKYVFTLESFQILNTRALHNDTDHVSFALKVGNTVYPAKVKHMGNKNNGTYKVALSFGPIDVPSADTKIVMTYLIMNAGHHQDKVSQWLSKGAEGLLSAAADAAGGPWSAIIEKVGDLGLGILFADCDGWVAGDHITFTGRSLSAFTKVHRETRNYPGIDSPRGCGSNSHYKVTWSVTPN